ncbi:DUF6114 domain-containing protein [Microbacterium rhizosphaerae]|uniref:DUF6114 domain-containing protein n=1 Tax=Microbacterium rhizosphaerae TaxID=1678237 RepID=A0ABZ0SLV1_9MICO|nr:DUF6114 domain-containing protein [Microbacterium rhizosphaerae]WPR88186.1 DUF6114 domain-containing protein [Microbacterium rhizosphaerae]
MSTSVPRRFARFYRSRPLVGGSLIVLAGLAVFMSTQLDLGKIHIQVGIEGFQALVIPIALVALGVLIIADARHRIFYGVIALAVAIYAVVGVNLGGFLVGTILGIAGAVVALSWMPPTAASPEPTDTAESTDEEALDADPLGFDDLLEPAEAAAVTDASPVPEPRPFVRRPADTGRGGRSGLRTFALAGAVALCGVAIATGMPAQAAHAESPLCTGLLGILCPPASSPSPTPSPSGTSTTSPGPLPLPPAGVPGASTPVSAPQTGATPSPSATLPPGVPPSASALTAPQPADTSVALDPAAPVVATESATLTATSLSQTNGRYVDTVLLRRPDGSTVRALKILGDAGLLKNMRLHGTGAHHGAGIDASQLDVAGPIHFYAAAFSGKAFGILPLSWNVDSPPPVGVPMPPFTDVTVELVYFDAGGQTLTASHITPQ